MAYSQSKRLRRGQTHANEQEFRCVHCGLLISCSPIVAGVQNRNHCPCCLHSRHLDWRTPGDRLSGCRGAMEPVGLTTKRSRNKYARERDGELMIVHRCTQCGKIDINRIAADDSEPALLELFAATCAPGSAFVAELRLMGVAILTADDSDLVRRRLFGNRRIDELYEPAQDAA